jgi:hypothetical protein
MHNREDAMHKLKCVTSKSATKLDDAISASERGATLKNTL